MRLLVFTLLALLQPAVQASDATKSFGVRLVVENTCHEPAARDHDGEKPKITMACSDRAYRVEPLARWESHDSAQDGSEYRSLMLVF